MGPYFPYSPSDMGNWLMQGRDHAWRLISSAQYKGDALERTGVFLAIGAGEGLLGELVFKNQIFNLQTVSFVTRELKDLNLKFITLVRIFIETDIFTAV